MTTTETPWLTDREQRVWRQWVRATSALPAELNRHLQQEHSLSLQDYEVLVWLTDVETGQIRMSDLAEMLHWDRSRLSHHITRMTSRGLVERRQCPEDGRGAFVAITDQGRGSIEAAAKRHVDGVRALLFDGMTEAELAALESVTSRVLERLDVPTRPADAQA